MTKEQLKHLEEELRADDYLSAEYEPATPDDGFPWEASLSYVPGVGFIANMRVWSGYYSYPETRMQPAERGWNDWEDVEVRSPFLTDCLVELENRGIDPMSLAA